MSPRQLLPVLVALTALGCSTPTGGGPAYSLPGLDSSGLPGAKKDAAGPFGPGQDAGVADGEELADGATPVDGADPAADAAAAPPKAEDLLDTDNDGYTPLQGDCDDADPAVNPGMAEKCDGDDDDCNGVVDDRDFDQDGFSSCPGPLQDCDDDKASVHPGAKADCSNDLDNDCSGGIDSGEDQDGDGHLVCTDCDDTDPLVFPGAATNCKNGKDNDCDGQVDGAFDGDGDGSPKCEDCDDTDPTVAPGMPELCDGKDNDCSGLADDKDDDGDGWPGCGPDCDDTDFGVNPSAARNCQNGKDNDCSGVVDAVEDGDGDGAVGCDDCNDYNAGVSKSAIEYGADLLDNDCDGQTDEPPAPCDVAGLSSNKDADYAKAIDLCHGVKSSTFTTLADAAARAIHKQYGPKNLPILGPSFAVLSSGKAAAAGQPGYVSPQSGSSFSNSAPYPNVKCKKSGAVYDYTEWKLVLQVPSNAKAFSFEFNFMSAEYPEYVGTSYDDKFLAVLESKSFNGNVSFDSKGNCISINSALFSVCQGCPLGAADLQGTGYEGGIGGGTGWLTTTVPVQPGETITLRFIVFDEGDHILDSVVVIDDFRWLSKSAKGSPSTVRPGG